MANLKTLLKRLDKLQDKMFDLAERNFDSMQADQAARDDSGPDGDSRRRSKQLDKLRNEERKLKSQINVAQDKAKMARKISGMGGGGGSIKSPDETARGRMSLLKKKM
jgi:hypothetical protein